MLKNLYYEREKKSKKSPAGQSKVDNRLHDVAWNLKWTMTRLFISMQSFRSPSRVEIAKEEKNGVLEFTNLIRICFSGHSIKHKQIVSSREFSILPAVCLMTEILNIKCHVPNYQEILIFWRCLKWDLPVNESKVTLKRFFILFLFREWKKPEANLESK